MRLINLHTMQLEELNEKDVPRYAILSHMWEREEVGFKDWPNQTHASHLKGYRKILDFAKLARWKYHCNYGWVDTCCIDKSSSAELTEAINSMFRYYSNASVCIAYLADVVVDADSSDEEALAGKVCSSRWFTRGWTLQELIAPSTVKFYDSAWNRLGRMSPLLADRIETVTGIPKGVLLKTSAPSDWSVAQRMSWASRRQTTRIEDEAYCLLGIFDVSLPLIYGEGRNAFMRLQEEIIRRSTDHSIFAWNFGSHNDSSISRSSTTTDSIASGESRSETASATYQPSWPSQTWLSYVTWHLLASSPADFANGNTIVQCYHDVKGWIESFEMTNLGLSLSLPLVPCTSQLGVYHAVLNCRFRDNEKGPIALNLKRTSQASTASQLEGNYDLQTTVFGVSRLRTDIDDQGKFQCGSDHLDRYSVIEEEDLLSNEKTRVTVLRSYRPAVVSELKREPTKARVVSIRRTKESRTFQPGRLKLLVSEDVPPYAGRKQAIPEHQWDQRSNIWYAKSDSCAISLTWEHLTSIITFVFVKGKGRDVPYYLGVVESISPDVIDFAELQEFDREQLDGLGLGQTMAYDLQFATFKVTIERVEKMAKFFNLVTVTVTKKPSLWPAPVDEENMSLQLPSGKSVKARLHTGTHEAGSAATSVDQSGSNELFAIPEEKSSVIGPGPSLRESDVHTSGAVALRRRFSFD